MRGELAEDVRGFAAGVERDVEPVAGDPARDRDRRVAADAFEALLDLCRSPAGPSRASARRSRAAPRARARAARRRASAAAPLRAPPARTSRQTKHLTLSNRSPSQMSSDARAMCLSAAALCSTPTANARPRGPRLPRMSVVSDVADPLGRLRSWRHATHAAICDIARPWACGTVVRASRYPRYWDFNLVRVERECEMRRRAADRARGPRAGRSAPPSPGLRPRAMGRAAVCDVRAARLGGRAAAVDAPRGPSESRRRRCRAHP